MLPNDLTNQYLFKGTSLKNATVSEFMDRVYLCELAITDTTESNTFVFYIDCYLCPDNGKLVARLYNKRDDFNFRIVNFPFLCRNIPSALRYGVYMSQLTRYDRVCCKYKDFVDREKLLANKLLLQDYCKAKILETVKSSMGDIMTSLVPTMLPFLNLFQI